MNTVINGDNIKSFAYTNEHMLKEKPVGVVTYLHGLGRGQELTEDFFGAAYLAEHGILLVYPYSNPWGWANEDTIKYIDECIDAALIKYGKELPVCIAGGSMGGFTSLVYAFTTKREIAACAADCPVCDLERRWIIKNDKKTVYSAYCGKIKTETENAAEDFISVIKNRSPINNIDKFPKIPYYINQGTIDKIVSKSDHSDRLVPLMRSAGYDITYCEPETGHCQFNDESFAKYFDFMVNAIGRNTIGTM